MRYQKRYNKFSFQTNCRICLTQSMGTKYSLTNPIRQSESEITIQKALEIVTNEKVPMDHDYPNTVCAMCFEFLKISYDFVQQYKGSMEKLKQHLGEVETVIESSAEDEPFQVEIPVSVPIIQKLVPDQKDPTVEILVGNEKFNIRDILIVEDDNDELPDFEGFLKNLGKTVSATFVKKDYQKHSLDEEEPSLVIEKIVHVNQVRATRRTGIIKMNAKSLEKLSNDNILNNDLPFDNSENDMSENDLLVKENCKTDVYKNIEDLSENEKTALKSALNFKYKCRHCNKFMSSLTRAKIHSKRCGKEAKHLSCHVCDKKFDSRRSLLLHFKQKHLAELPENSDLTAYYKCKICNKNFWSKGGLAYHYKTHNGKKYICDQCSRPFYTSSALKNHMQVHARDKTVVVCPICGKGFHYKGGLFYHMKIHRNERNLHCSYCPRRFYTTNSIKRHELTHTGDRPYACDCCEKKFRSMGELKMHHLQHTNEKPIKCKYCTAGFRQMYNRNVHMMTHRGDFECSSCGKGFADEDILRFHLKTKHAIRNKTDVVIAEENNTCEQPQELEDNIAPQYIQLEGEADTLQFDGEQYYITEYIEEAEIQNASDVIVSQMNTAGSSSKSEVLVETVETFE